MTAIALITGSLFRDPERKTSKAGKQFVSATIKVRDGEQTIFWRVVAFSQSAADELMRLTDGDAVSCQGVMRAELYEPEGKPARINLSLVADQVLAARQPAKPRESRSDPSRPAGAPADYRARQGRSRAEQAVNGGLRHYPGAADPDLDDDPPPF